MLALHRSITAKKYEVFFTGPGAPFDALFPQHVKRWQSPHTHSYTDSKVVSRTLGRIPTPSRSNLLMHMAQYLYYSIPWGIEDVRKAEIGSFLGY